MNVSLGTCFNLYPVSLHLQIVFWTLLSFLFPSFQRIPLDFLNGEKFREAADNYIRPLLRKVSLVFTSITPTG